MIISKKNYSTNHLQVKNYKSEKIKNCKYLGTNKTQKENKWKRKDGLLQQTNTFWGWCRYSNKNFYQEKQKYIT